MPEYWHPIIDKQLTLLGNYGSKLEATARLVRGPIVMIPKFP